MSNKTVTLPRKLTAENGAKKLLIGEFFEVVSRDCDCFLKNHDYEGDECKQCNGTGVYIEKIQVKWTTIKAIYDKIAEQYG